MNLHAYASPYTATVSPLITGTLYVSTGYTLVNYAQTPSWQAFTDILFDVQAMSGGDIRQVSALNIQGVMRAVYLNGNIEGLDRPAGKGGDVLYFDNQWWLVAAVLEPWANNGWTKVAVVLQNGAPPGL
jgi:hypothetical protein